MMNDYCMTPLNTLWSDQCHQGLTEGGSASMVDVNSKVAALRDTPSKHRKGTAHALLVGGA